MTEEEFQKRLNEQGLNAGKSSRGNAKTAGVQKLQGKYTEISALCHEVENSTPTTN